MYLSVSFSNLCTKGFDSRFQTTNKARFQSKVSSQTVANTRLATRPEDDVADDDVVGGVAGRGVVSGVHHHPQVDRKISSPLPASSGGPGPQKSLSRYNQKNLKSENQLSAKSFFFYFTKSKPQFANVKISQSIFPRNPAILFQNSVFPNFL